MRKLIALLVIFTAVVSCKKDYTITGRIYNAATGEGVANSKVLFTPKIRKGENKKTVELTTDANGYYSYKGKVNLNKAQRILFSDFQTHEYHLLAPYDRALLDGNKENVEDLAFLRVLPAYLLYKDTNSNSGTQVKFVYIRLQSKISSTYYPDMYKLDATFSGQDSYSAVKKQLVEGWNYVDGYVTYQGSESRSFRDSLYVTPTPNDSLVQTLIF